MIQGNSEEAGRRLDREFSAQISVLKRFNCPKGIIKTLESKRQSVITKAVGMCFLGSKRILFCPVIPTPHLSVPEQMLMVLNNDVPGCTFISPKDITDEVDAPREPYFIFGIDDGAKTLGWTPHQAERTFSRQPRRRGLNCAEAIGLCRASDVLSRFNIDAIASRVKKAKIPFLWVVGREPRLGADKVNTSNPNWGIPSCNTMVI
jgi:hypothetical protein